MILYIVRHDRAVDGGRGASDALRYLTAKGRSRFRETAAAARDAGMRVDAIVTSPLVRAVQTADLLAEGLEYRGEVVADLLLASGPSRSEIPVLAEAHGAKEGLAVVGHNPQLTGLVHELLGPEGDFCMKKGAVVAVRLPGGKGVRRGEFLWMVVDGRRHDKLMS